MPDKILQHYYYRDYVQSDLLTIKQMVPVNTSEEVVFLDLLKAKPAG